VAKVVDGTASMNDLARSIRLDPSGDVVAAGEVQNTATGRTSSS